MKIQPLANAPFGARVTDIDCAAARADEVDELRQSLHRHQLLLFPRQRHLTPRQEVGFYRSINPAGKGVWRDQKNNPWEVYKVEQGNQAGTYQIPDEPGVLVIGKGEIDHYGLRVMLGGARGAYGEESGSQVLGGGVLQWHIDGPFYQFAPCDYTQMRCIEAPRGGGHWLPYADGSGQRLWCAAGSTAFASGRIAFDLLPPSERQNCLQIRVHYASNPFQASYALGNSGNGLRLLDVAAERLYAQGEDTPGAAVEDPLAQVYPLVWTCPLTGLQALMAQPRCMQALEIPAAGGSRFLGVVESRMLVEKWMRPAIDPGQVYVHAWQDGELALWNNRSVWHSATGKLAPEDRRVMHLTAFNGDEPPHCSYHLEE